MLDPAQIFEALEASWDRFVMDEAETGRLLDLFTHALAAFVDMPLATVEALLEGTKSTGALPTREHGAPGGRIRFRHRFENHTEARKWALDVLRGVPTLAVDGSQILPTKDYSIPIGLAQAGWFLNPHDPDLPYEKGVKALLLTPDELRHGAGGEDFVSASQVNLRRFELEVDQTIRLVKTHSNLVVFFDGSLILSFAEMFALDLRKAYIAAILRLLAASETYRTPVVGYLDTSYARDLCGLLAAIHRFDSAVAVSDAALVRRTLEWGDRTPVYRCARSGILDEYRIQDADFTGPRCDYSDQITFTYLEAASDRSPARLEIPRWVFEAGDHERVIDVVRAEIIAGASGYPYAIEAADATAVLTMADRDRFYGLLQQFAERKGGRLSYAAKARSKRTRR